MSDQRPGAKSGVPREKRQLRATIQPGPAVIGRAAHQASQRKLVGERIRRLRISRGLTQIRLAGRIGKSERTVAGWERGGWTPKALELLSGFFNVPVSHFAGTPAVRDARVASACNSFELELERRVVDALAARRIAEEAATLLLPSAPTLSALVLEALADGIQIRFDKTMRDASAGGRLLALVEDLRTRIAVIDPEVDRAARFAEQDAQVYRACWHRDRRSAERRAQRKDSTGRL